MNLIYIYRDLFSKKIGTFIVIFIYLIYPTNNFFLGWGGGGWDTFFFFFFFFFFLLQNTILTIKYQIYSIISVRIDSGGIKIL